MAITKTVVNRPTTFLIIFILLVGFGIYTSLNLAIDLLPDINFPILVVVTSYEGAGPEEVEKTVTRLLESQLSNVSNLEEISSTSQESSSMIRLDFTFGTNMAEASNDVRDRLEFVKDYLPEQATTPQIFKFDPSLIPILRLKVAGNRSPEDLRELSENLIQPRLEQIEGVALATINGGRQRIVEVAVPQNRLEAYGLNFTQIRMALLANNTQISAGTITQGDINYLVLSSGEFSSINQIKNTVITYKFSPPSVRNPAGKTVAVRLRDIGDVGDSYRERDSSVYINGEPGVFITIQKQSGKNSIQVADRVLEKIPEIVNSLPKGIEIGVVSNTTKFIRSSLQEVSSSALLGVVLAVLILLFFLRSIKSTIIIAFSIPISLVVTLMLMYFFNLTLNMMTLAGLALGVGMLVDNSIVILENIYRYREKGTKLHASAILGTQEMILAITASTLTTICVFLPLAVFRSQLDIYGEMFSGLAFTVVISLATSLLVALVLVPVLASKYIRLSTRYEIVLPPLLARTDRILGRFFNGFENLYKKALRWVLGHKKISLGATILVFIGSIILIPVIGFELMPPQEEDSININIELPVGTALGVTESVVFRIEEIIKEESIAYEDLVLSVGQRSMFGMISQTSTNKGTITLNLQSPETRKESSIIVKEKLRKHFNNFPDTKFTFSSGGMQGLNTSPIVITFKSEDRDLAKKISLRVLDLLKASVPEATEPTLNLQEGLPQLELNINREKAAALGLNMSSIGQELRANIDGITAGKYRTGGSEFDILLILDKASRNQLPDLDKIFVMNNAGRKIAVSSFAVVGYSTGPVAINRENQTRFLRINAGLAPGKNLGNVVTDIQGLIAAEIPPNDSLIIEYGGDFEDLLKYGSAFILILVISVFLVFGVMAALFESFLDPFIVLFTIPLTLIGVILIHFITGETLSLFTAIGMVVLVGIVVNNGIVLVDYTNLLKKRGRPLFEACVEAGGNRLRPVLMTTLTTVLALVPVAFTKSSGTSLVQPLAKTVVGGLTMSTLLTLFIIPTIYAIFNKWSDKLKAKRAVRLEARMQIRIQRLREERNR